MVGLGSLGGSREGQERPGGEVLRAARHVRPLRHLREAVARLQPIPGGWAPPPLLVGVLEG